MTKEEAYEKATMISIGNNPNGSRQDVIWLAMEIFRNDVVVELSKECRRIKVQRNEYEQELMKANREIMRLRTALKINAS